MSVRVTLLPHPFRVDIREVTECEPIPLRDYVTNTPNHVTWLYMLNGDQVGPDNVPRDGDRVIIRARPAGQDTREGDAKVGGWGAIGIGVIVTLAVIAGFVTGGFTWGLLGVGLTGLGLIGGGASAIYYSDDIGRVFDGNASGDTSEYQRLPGIRGSKNDARPGKTVPVVFGRHLITPPFGAQPYSRFIDNDQWLWETFVVGYTPIVVSAIKIGDTPITQYDEATANVYTGVTAGMYTNQVSAESVGVELKEENGYSERTVASGIDEIEIDIAAPAGVYKSDNGELVNHSVDFRIIVQTTTGTPVYDSTKTLSGSERRPIRKTYSIGVNAANAHLIRVKRVTADNDDTKLSDTLQWLGYKEITNESPYTTEAQQLFTRIDLKIKATDNLSGVVDELNCMAQAQYRDYTGSGTGTGSWTVQSTRNPASAFLYALQGPANKDPVPDSEIDWPSLEAWHQWCQTNGYYFDMVLDRGMPLARLLTAICAAGRAEWSVQAGKYRIIQDIPRSTPVQLVTPRNSWDFSGSKAYTGEMDALRVEFVNADVGYQPDERIIYNNGKDAGTADESTFETISLTGVTDPGQAFYLGRYLLRANVLRPERFTFKMDVEYLIAERGDLVEIQHDAGLIGIKPARVLETTDDGVDVTSITLDEAMPIDSAKTYGMRLRKADGTLVTVDLVTPQDDTNVFTVSASTPIPVGDIAPGDLGAFGESATETVEAIVDKIETFEDLTAQISVYKYNTDIYDIDSESVPVFESQLTDPSELSSRPPAPIIAEIWSDDRAATQNPDGTISAHMGVFVIVDSDAVPISDVEFGWRINGSSSPWGRRILTPDSQEIELDGVIAGQVYDIRIRSRRNDQTPSEWSEQQHTVLGPDWSILRNINAETRRLIESSQYGLDGGTPESRTPRYVVDGGTPEQRNPGRVFDSTLGPYDTLEQSLKAFVAAEYVDAATYGTKISEIEDQIDRSITTWYYSGNPTLANEPAVNWADDATRDTHLGDLYYNKDDGSAWRFLHDDATDTYLWVENVSPDVQEALDRSQDALDLADNKRRVFVSEPVAPYDIGDLWAQGGSGDGQIKRAQTAQPDPGSGGAFDAADWVDAADYVAKAADFTREWDQGGLDGGTPDARTPGRTVDGGTPAPRNPIRKFEGGFTNVNGKTVLQQTESVALNVALSLGYDTADQMYADLQTTPLLNKDNGYLINFRFIDVDALVANTALISLIFTNQIKVATEGAIYTGGFEADGSNPTNANGVYIDGGGGLYLQGPGLKVAPSGSEFDWASVVGGAKPADNATQGAPNGSPIGPVAVGVRPPNGKTTGSNDWSGVIASADWNGNADGNDSTTGSFWNLNNGKIVTNSGTFRGLIDGGSININGKFAVDASGNVTIAGDLNIGPSGTIKTSPFGGRSELNDFTFNTQPVPAQGFTRSISASGSDAVVFDVRKFITPITSQYRIEWYNSFDGIRPFIIISQAHDEWEYASYPIGQPSGERTYHECSQSIRVNTSYPSAQLALQLEPGCYYVLVGAYRTFYNGTSFTYTYYTDFMQNTAIRTSTGILVESEVSKTIRSALNYEHTGEQFPGHVGMPRIIHGYQELGAGDYARY